MKYNKARGFCALLAAVMLAGCSSGGGQQVSIADFGGSGGVDYSDSVQQNLPDMASQEEPTAEPTHTLPAQETSETSAEEPEQTSAPAQATETSAQTTKPQTTTATSGSSVTSVTTAETTVKTTLRRPRPKRLLKYRSTISAAAPTRR